jgi:hypothetical protein
MSTEYAQKKAWLSSLQAGDDVHFHGRYGNGPGYIAQVTRVTPTQIVIGDSRFDKEDGRRRGSHGFHVEWIYEPTDDIREAIMLRDQRVRVERRIAEIKFKDLDIEQIAVLDEALDKVGIK